MSDPAPPPDGTSEPEEAPTPEPVPLLTLRDGLPPVIDDRARLDEFVERLASGTGPVAIDAERASGYRYSQRAYLIQLRRAGSGTALIDPIAFESLAPLAEVLEDTEWILHAATQDLPCLAEVGLRPSALFDTELAGRLLGHPRVGLATLVETTLGRHLRKEHSSADWSTRPLPTSWLEYAALDVEPLIELREVLAAELEATGKAEWARQEFERLLDFAPVPRTDPWRRTSQLHRVKGRRSLAAVRELWQARDTLAAERDVTPGRIIPDSAIVAAAQSMPQDRTALLDTKGFHGRGARRYAATWVTALRTATELPESDLPQRNPRGDGPPPPRSWADRDPVAARRLAIAKDDVAELAEEHHLPVENLLTPDILRRVLWAPPRSREPATLSERLTELLLAHGARPWQVALMEPVISAAVLAADEEPTPEGSPGHS